MEWKSLYPRSHGEGRVYKQGWKRNIQKAKFQSECGVHSHWWMLKDGKGARNCRTPDFVFSGRESVRRERGNTSSKPTGLDLTISHHYLSEPQATIMSLRSLLIGTINLKFSSLSSIACIAFVVFVQN